MSRGGHHGGSFHSGGHHGGGGGFSGGGHYSGRHYGGGGYSGGFNANRFLIDIIIIALALLYLGLYCLYMAFQSSFDAINVPIMILSIALFVVASFTKGKVSAVQDLKRSPTPHSCANAMYDKVYSRGGYGTKDGVSWYTNDKFCLIFDERYSRKENLRMAHEEIKKWPFILKINDVVWPICAVIWFIANLFFYEKVIPFAENAIMSDQAFAFIDDLVYYLPAIMMLLNAVAALVIGIVRLKFARKVCIYVVNTNISNQVIAETGEEIEVIIEQLWYHDTCPNCSGDALSHDTRCKNCGSSLKILNPASVPVDKRHQVQSTRPKETTK